jgi:hypothetical protein
MPGSSQICGTPRPVALGRLLPIYQEGFLIVYVGATEAGWPRASGNREFEDGERGEQRAGASKPGSRDAVT